MPGIVSTSRTALNVSGSPARYRVTVEAPAGASIVVSPSSFSVGPGTTVTLDITIEGQGLAEGQYFGRVNLEPRSRAANPVTLPVAFFKTQGDVALTHECDPTSIPRGTTSSCSVTATNFAPVDTAYELSVSGPLARFVRIQNASAPAVPSGNGWTASGTLTAALGPPIESMMPGGSPAGYLPLSIFGITPTAMGDETLVNFDVPSFLFGTETYGRIAATSNGYAVIGGGDSTDLDYIPQSFPNPARPNNVLAPFWTDLNPSTGGAFRAGILTDGVTDWLVFDWAGVPTYGTTELQSFEIWVELGANESITYAYGTTTGTGAPDGLTVGAENRDGTSGVMLGSVPASGTDYTITAGSPIAGGAVTVTYDALGRRRGTFELVAALETDITPGVTTEVVTLEVT
jgi:hypothetical protein